MGHYRFFHSLGLVAGLVLAASVAAQAGSLRVTGEGSVSAVPDSAEVRMSVLAAGPRAEPAMAELSANLSDILTALKNAGIAESDLQTTSLRLDPVFAPYNQREDNRPPRIDGYRASTGLSVRVDQIDRLGMIIDAALSAGANGFDGVQFLLSDTSEPRRTARVRAVDDAFQKARTYAEAAGLRLGDVLEITEGGSSVPSPFSMAEMRVADAGVELAEGVLTLEERVTIVFEVEAASE